MDLLQNFDSLIAVLRFQEKVRKIFHFMVGHYMHLIFDQLTIPEVIHTTKRQFRINNIEIDHSIHTDSDRVPWQYLRVKNEKEFLGIWSDQCNEVGDVNRWGKIKWDKYSELHLKWILGRQLFSVVAMLKMYLFTLLQDYGSHQFIKIPCDWDTKWRLLVRAKLKSINFQIEVSNQQRHPCQ